MAQNTEYTEYRKKIASEDTPFSQPIFDFSQTLVTSSFLTTTPIFNTRSTTFNFQELTFSRFNINNKL